MRWLGSHHYFNKEALVISDANDTSAVTMNFMANDGNIFLIIWVEEVQLGMPIYSHFIELQEVTSCIHDESWLRNDVVLVINDDVLMW
jgi:hypothetical protein